MLYSFDAQIAKFSIYTYHYIVLRSLKYSAGYY